MHWPKSGPSHVGEFQVSGVPFVTSCSGALSIQFPYLTQWILIKTTQAVTAAFTTGGFATGNAITLPANTTLGPLYWRITDLHLSGGATEVIAGLTTVERRDCFVLIASGTSTGSLSYNDTRFWSYSGI
jgi:hypothetical protein